MKKKGFTLIELLAVIIILAILAFILIPVIQDLISDARYGAAADSVLNYVHAANTQASVDVGGFEEYKLNLSDTFELDSEIDTEELNKIKFNGKGPTYVYLLFSGEHKYVSEAHFCMWGYSIDYNFETGTSKSDLDYCGGEGMEPEGDPTCDVLRNNKYDDTEVFKINNVEDLVCVSELAKTKTFENKTIYLIKDIDFNKDSSYENPNNTAYGDINGNGEIEGLKTELTTGSGFYPIGSSTTPFKGTFEGYAKSISNLMINRTQDNVGLFGYNQGKIQGFNISADVTGSSNVGSIAGINQSGIINEIIADVTVKSSTSSGNTEYRIGGIVGFLSEGGSVTSILIKNSDVSIPANSYGNDIGCAVGKSNHYKNVISAIVEAGSIKNGDHIYSGGGWRVGKIVGQGGGTITGYVGEFVVGSASGNNGTTFKVKDEVLNSYDSILDTYIGDDNDDSGYYFDYENETSNKIIIKRTTKNPIKFTLAGNGTESNPYILDNVQHFKEASTLAGNGNSYYFKLTQDLDFSNRHYYELGTIGNAFNSDIDGDMHTISNVSFNCIESCGLVSKNSNTIESIVLDNISISGESTIGGIAGNNEGTIKGIIATNVNITGGTTLGGIVGNSSGGTISDIVASVKISSLDTDASGIEYKMGGIVGYLNIGGSVTSILMKNSDILIPANSYGHDIGCIVGKSNHFSNIISGIVEAGSIKNGDHIYNGGGWRVGKIAGQGGGTITGYVSENVVGSASGNNGITYELKDEILNLYDNALDTYIGGDNDGSNYYFDYESDGSSTIVLKRTKDEPITFTLAGKGTESEPYIIDNYQHFKEASQIAKDGTKLKITADIDFSGKHYYALGTLGNPFDSDIDGDMHTLSNISFNCAEMCGLISRNIGHTIEGLNLNNINITSSSNTVGGLVAYNEGTIKGINATNMNITGGLIVGGIVGESNGIINEVSADVKVNSFISDASGPSYSMGGVVGQISAYSTVTNVLLRNASIQIPANSYGHDIGGIVGKSSHYKNVLTGVVETGYIKNGDHIYGGGGWRLGKIAGQAGGTITGYASDKMQLGAVTGNNGTTYTLVPPTTVTYTENNNTVEIDSLTYYENTGLLDTVIGGDDDGSGYYLQYSNSGDSIIVVKAGNTPTPSPTPDPGSGEPLEGGSVGENPPTCVLERVISRDSGIQPVLTCTDEEGAPTIRSQWNVNKNATTNQFSDIGIVKNGTVNGNSKTVRPYWSTSDPISVPTKDTCYYFRFGAQDASGNWSYYVTSKCYYGFGRSND